MRRRKVHRRPPSFSIHLDALYRRPIPLLNLNFLNFVCCFPRGTLRKTIDGCIHFRRALRIVIKGKSIMTPFLSFTRRFNRNQTPFSPLFGFYFLSNLPHSRASSTRYHLVSPLFVEDNNFK